METVDWDAVYAKPPPVFGHDMKQFYELDPEYVNLNNGSYGTTPKPVLQAVRDLGIKIERNPDLFHRVLYQPKLTEVRQKLANMLGVKLNEIVLVTNASMGISTVMRNIHWESEDIIFSFTTTYNSVAKTAKATADTPPNPTSVIIELSFPTTKAKILAAIEEAFKQHPAPPNKKRVALIDSICSNPGVLLPWKEIVQICKQSEVWSVVDGAHSIGQEAGLDLKNADPDFWVSNCHKWLSAKRSVAVFYVPERNQHIIKTSIPTSAFYISPEARNGEPNFVEQYEWNGTIDWASNLTVLDALRFRTWIGGEEKINKYCHDLALKGGKVLAKALGTKEMDPDGEFTLNMVNVELPLPSSLKHTPEVDKIIKLKLLEKYKGYSAYYYHNETWWTRCSAQVWNTIEDFERLGEIWLKVVDEVKRELKVQ